MNTSFVRRLRTLTITTGVAMSLIIGAGAACDVAAQEQVADADCQADRSNHLLGGLLTDELTFLSDLLPFTIAGEQ